MGKHHPRSRVGDTCTPPIMYRYIFDLKLMVPYPLVRLILFNCFEQCRYKILQELAPAGRPSKTQQIMPFHNDCQKTPLWATRNEQTNIINTQYITRKCVYIINLKQKIERTAKSEEGTYHSQVILSICNCW